MNNCIYCGSPLHAGRCPSCSSPVRPLLKHVFDLLPGRPQLLAYFVGLVLMLGGVPAMAQPADELQTSNLKSPPKLVLKLGDASPDALARHTSHSSHSSHRSHSSHSSHSSHYSGSSPSYPSTGGYPSGSGTEYSPGYTTSSPTSIPTGGGISLKNLTRLDMTLSYVDLSSQTLEGRDESGKRIEISIEPSTVHVYDSLGTKVGPQALREKQSVIVYRSNNSATSRSWATYVWLREPVNQTPSPLPATWETYTAPDGSFSVELPPGYKVDTTEGLAVEKDGPTLAYIAKQMPMDPGMAAENVQRIKASILDKGCILVQEEAFHDGDMDGIQVVMVAENGALAVGRIFTKGSYLYILVGMKKSGSDLNVLSFWRSFSAK